MQRGYTHLEGLLFLDLVFHALFTHADHLSGGFGFPANRARGTWCWS